MQRIALVLAAFLILAFQLPASPCVAGGTLFSYESLGATGCTVGPQTVNNFSYSATASGGGTAVADTDIFVTPAFGVNLHGLIFASPDFNVPTGSVTYLIGFTWDSLPIRGMDDVLDPGNPNILTDGCEGAAFVGVSCSGTPTSVDVFPTQLTDSVTFPNTLILGISNTITMNATSSFASLENDVSVVPEPSSILLAALGATILASVLIKRILTSRAG